MVRISNDSINKLDRRISINNESRKHGHEHVKDGIKNFVEVISVLKMNRVLDALKRLKRTHLQALLDTNSAQTEEGLGEQLSDTQLTISHAFRMLTYDGKDSEER